MAKKALRSQRQGGRVAKHVRIYTDGACRGNPGPGGWAAILRYNGHEKIIYGAEEHTTNNRMELLAVIKALASLKHACEVDVTTDSQYVCNGISKWIIAWRKKSWRTANNKPVKNADLWQALDSEANRHQVKWHWVRGHAGHPENELADEYANKAIDEFMIERGE